MLNKPVQNPLAEIREVGTPSIFPFEAEAMGWVLSHLTPDLLSPAYSEGWTRENPTYGFCSVASEALFFLLGGPSAGWKAMVGRDTSDGTHWWLQHSSGRRLDPTADQYTSQGLPLPYAKGRAAAFMGIRVDPESPWGFERRPSRRAALLLNTLLREVDINPDRIGDVRSWIDAQRGWRCAVPKMARIHRARLG